MQEAVGQERGRHSCGDAASSTDGADVGTQHETSVQCVGRMEQEVVGAPREEVWVRTVVALVEVDDETCEAVFGEVWTGSGLQREFYTAL